MRYRLTSRGRDFLWDLGKRNVWSLPTETYNIYEFLFALSRGNDNGLVSWAEDKWDNDRLDRENRIKVLRYLKDVQTLIDEGYVEEVDN